MLVRFGYVDIFLRTYNIYIYASCDFFIFLSERSIWGLLPDRVFFFLSLSLFSRPRAGLATV